MQITATVEPGDQGKEYAQVAVRVGDNEVTFVVHESLVYENTINIEIDGDLTESNPSLRINLNDFLVFDSVRAAPPLEDEDDRKPAT